MAQTYQLNDAILVFLDLQLQQRLEQNRQHMILLVAALAVVFVLILYLYGGFYASTRTTLRRLGLVMDKVAAGDMTVSFVAHSRDELGELGRVFNGTVVKIHDLIERGGSRSSSDAGGDRVSVEQSGGGRAAQPDRAGCHGHEPDVCHVPGSSAQCRRSRQQRP